MTRPDNSRGRFALDRRKVLLGLGMIAASGIAQARLPEPNRPRVDADEFDAMFPDSIGGWRYATQSGLVLPPSDALSDRLYDNLVTRVYHDSAGRTLMLLVAYNNRQDGVLQIHRPEICYPAGGYELTPTRHVDVPLGSGAILPCQGFAAKSRQRNEVVVYWTRVGDEFPRSWAEQRLAVAKANLKGIIPDGVLVRISTLGSELADDVPVLSDFIADLTRLPAPRLENLLFGRSMPEQST